MVVVILVGINYYFWFIHFLFRYIKEDFHLTNYKTKSVLNIYNYTEKVIVKKYIGQWIDVQCCKSPIMIKKFNQMYVYIIYIYPIADKLALVLRKNTNYSLILIFCIKSSHLKEKANILLACLQSIDYKTCNLNLTFQ